jgi:antitoxin HicB
MTRNAQLDEILARPYTIEFVYGETPDEGVVAQVAEWPGCMTAGATREEAIAHLEDAMHDWAEARLKAKLEIPEPFAIYSGKILLRMPRSVHRAVEQRAREEGTSLNTWLTTAIARELGPATKVRAATAIRSASGAARGKRAHRSRN